MPGEARQPYSQAFQSFKPKHKDSVDVNQQALTEWKAKKPSPKFSLRGSNRAASALHYGRGVHRNQRTGIANHDYQENFQAFRPKAPKDINKEVVEAWKAKRLEATSASDLKDPLPGKEVEYGRSIKCMSPTASFQKFTATVVERMEECKARVGKEAEGGNVLLTAEEVAYARGCDRGRRKKEALAPYQASFQSFTPKRRDHANINEQVVESWKKRAQENKAKSGYEIANEKGPIPPPREKVPTRAELAAR
jgi:hypothetical protein